MGQGREAPGGALECQCLSQGVLGLWEAGFLLWEVIVMRLHDGIPQTCRQCILGVTGKSEMNHWCEVSFCILDKTQRDLFLGWEGRGPDSCCIAVDHRGKGGVFYHCPTVCSESWRNVNVALKYGQVFPGLALFSLSWES